MHRFIIVALAGFALVSCNRFPHNGLQIAGMLPREGDGTLDPGTDGRVPTVYNVRRDGSLISSFPTSVFSAAATSPQAIAYDSYSDSLCITDNAADAVFNVSTAGVFMGSFPTDAGPFVTAVTNVQGITVESATHLWITGRTTGMLYRVTKTGIR